MNLRKYEGEYVRLHTTDGEVYEGYVSDYIFPEDNEPEEVESLVLEIPGREYLTEFPGREIELVEIIDKKDVRL